ncbi:MAG: DUF2207 domain-containing protein [Alphaproteobacteria bacterium]|nr:DUF2207 domain-containing protein [Alphaproteobacteria bacterium]
MRRANLFATILPVFGLSLSLAAPVEALAQERITDFDSTIHILGDGAVAVTERITVIAAGDQIKRGIYREFPTSYRDRYGNNVRINFRVASVDRDGSKEPYHTESAGSGRRVYIGDRDVFLDPGSYTYTIKYVADRQVGFFEEFDELYWNVTGNNWAFPIDHASATVILPSGASIVQSAAYTGALGASGTDFAYRLDTSGEPVFETTRPLAIGEGLTIAVAWPKGLIAEPDAADRLRYLVRDNLGLAATVGGLILLLAYYFGIWFRVGRGPPSGTIVPLFEPPAGFSAAAVRYTRRMGFDDKTFTAAIIGMAVKGHAEIHEEANHEFRLEKVSADATGLSPGEKAVSRKLFARSKSVVLKNKNHKRIRKARKGLESYLDAELQKNLFVRNRRYIVPGIILTVMIAILVVISSREPLFGVFIIFWLTFWTVGCYFVLSRALAAFRISLGRGIGLLFVAAIFLVGEGFGLLGLADTTSIPTALCFVALAATNAVFLDIMKAPTLLGRQIMDEIEGFRLYLSVAEKERLDVLHPTDRTPEIYERYLPYALALDVEQAWSEQFSEILDKAVAEGSYRPRWYSGPLGHRFDTSTIAGRLGGSFTGAVATASSAPGSSSGSGGGGSSGGGGGGGGGGGW